MLTSRDHVTNKVHPKQNIFTKLANKHKKFLRNSHHLTVRVHKLEIFDVYYKKDERSVIIHTVTLFINFKCKLIHSVVLLCSIVFAFISSKIENLYKFSAKGV